eukprot:TRINITY_DN2042_c0_g1_i1.p1 TRINITY_DN2042_c0_g1~~TRINITY_DN2042_c0_g1_i1.p1  ORF type:complete len:325 (-),score=34.71 TRINITY_DN2042_c0_g1_i1:181-1155(-)
MGGVRSSIVIKNEFQFLGAFRTVPARPWNPLDYFRTVRGAEYLQLYCWMLKDFAWTCDYYYMGMICGAFALFMTVWLNALAIYYKHWVELWHYIATFLWIWGNFWWAYSELHDHQFPNEKPIYDEHTEDTSWILTAGMCWLGLYYFVVYPLKLLPPVSEEVDDIFDECPVVLPTALSSVFPKLRNIENLHILCWLGKDTAWAFLIKPFWIVFLIPTVVLSFIFFVVTSFQKHRFVSNMHYMMQCLWIAANILWAYGEIWELDDDLPWNIFNFSYEPTHTMRYYSSWVLFVSLLVAILIYLIWIPLTILGMTTEQREAKESKHSS